MRAAGTLVMQSWSINQMAGPLWRRFRELLPSLFRLYAPAILLLAGIVVMRLAGDIPMADVTRDPAQALGHSPFVGALSNLGVLLWSAAAAACLFAAGLLHRRGDGPWRWPVGFLRMAGLLTLALMLDDLFLLHEVVFPQYLGVSELALYFIYAAVLGAMLIRYGPHILQTDYPILLLALGFFAASLLVDAISEFVLLPGTFLLEDGSKFLGIVGWAAFLIRTSAAAVRARMKDGQPQLDADHR